MALRRHRLPRLWLALTLGPVLLSVGFIYWWERQLPARIRQSVAEGRLEDCLRYSDQLAALSWSQGGVPKEQSHCRRQRAQQLWQQQRWSEALSLQRQLVLSFQALPQDRQRLSQWRDNLRAEAMARFIAGDLQAALHRLEPIGELNRSGGLGEEMQTIWQRNRLLLERAERLNRQSRWWEALDALNRIDHPWWRQRSVPVRDKVQQGVASLKGHEREHDAHGAVPHSVDPARLDELVRRRIAAGMEEWKAFDLSCRELGGQLREEGPDTACER